MATGRQRSSARVLRALFVASVVAVAAVPVVALAEEPTAPPAEAPAVPDTSSVPADPAPASTSPAAESIEPSTSSTTTEPPTTTPTAGGISIAADGELSVVKTASKSVILPGEELEYRITGSCSSLTTNCQNFTLVDVLPAEFEVTALPQSNSLRTVTFDPGTRTLTVVFTLPFPGAPGQTGLPAGAAQSLAIGMRLPQQTPVLDAQVITNTATASAVGFTDDTDSVSVTASIPVRLQPVATKAWSPSAAIAQSGAASVITLGVRNASTSSAQVTELAVADTTAATFERFDLTSAGTLSRFPTGADRVVVDLCTKPIGTPCVNPGDWASSAPAAAVSLPMALVAPVGVNLADVTGVRYRFFDDVGGLLPYDATPAEVLLDMALRDTYRSTAAPITPTVTERVTNCATPSVVAVSGSATGTDACARYAIEPDSVTVSGTKTIYSDPTGSFTPGGVVVVGLDSPVSMRITAKNDAAFAVPVMRIVEPSPTVTSDWDKLRIDRGRFTFPAGATTATLKVTCWSGADPADVTFTRPPNPQTVTLASLGCGVGAKTVRIDFTGVDGVTSEPLIAAAAVGSLELHGAATGATMADVSDGGLRNCATVFIASQIDGTGSATADTCAITAVEAPRPGVGSASKTSFGVYSIVPGQDMAFRLSFRNRGNVPVSNVVLVDPPDPTAAGAPFSKVRLTRLAAATTNPASTLEVYDPTVSTYVPYVASNVALLARATGIRVTVTGNLAVNQTFTVDYAVQLRDGMPVGTSFRNCAAVGIETPDLAAPFCLPSTVTNGVPGSGASLNKSITPSTVTRPQPGLPAQVVTVKHRTQNTGTLYLKQLIVTDTDADFFDAVVFRGSIAVNFPQGANRVRVDVCTSAAACAAGTWVVGTRTASNTPSIPGGVVADTVKGIRFVFENSNNGYEILPAPNFPSTGNCPDATVCFKAEVRQFLATSPTTPVPDRLMNTSSGAGLSELQTPGSTFPIPEVSSTLDVLPGSPRLSLDKGPDSRIGPGDQAPISLVATNTGTDAVVTPRLVDPLPALLTFDPVIAGAAAGQPYLVDYVLPAGYAPPATVTFTQLKGDAGVPGCTDVNRVCALSWSFPGWNLPPGGKIRVQFNVTLTPGVTAGQSITNTAGVTGANEGLQCSGASLVSDPAYGAGRYCIDSAVVTALAGDDFIAQKWVAADPALGFLDATGAVVPVTTSECPRYVSGGTVYTRFPCTARVLPGQTIDYLIRGVNSGTNPATRIVLVDGLPVQGDTGVLLSGQQRGTQWNNRPTMASPVVNVEGYAGAVTEYATATFPGAMCTADLGAPPSACPAGSFSPGVSAGATGFRTVLTFSGADLLQPGESFTLTWQMRAPSSVTSSLTEPIAWNSFALRPTFQVGSGTTTLPATEPVKVGVGMPLGSFTVIKRVDGLPPGIPLDPFEFAYRCSLTGFDGTTVVVAADVFSLVDGGVFTGPQVPKGATCRIWETDAQGGQSPNIGADDAAVVLIDSLPGPQDVTVVNTYDSGSVTLHKTVVWGAGVAPFSIIDPFLVSVDCGFPTLGDGLPGFPRSISITDGASETIADLPVGTTCVVEETDRQGATVTVMNPSNAEPVEEDSVIVSVAPDADGGTVVDIENHYETGGIELVKVLDGSASQWAQGPFVFDIDCTAPALTPVNETVVLQPEDLSATISPIPAGYQCTVTETDRGGAADSVVSPATFTIPVATPGSEPPGPVLVTSVNRFVGGRLTLSKVLTGSAAAPMANALFGVRVQCERTLADGDGVQTIVDRTVELRGGASVLLPEPLPVGARCWADETNMVGAHHVVVSHTAANKAVVTELAPDIAITVTNTYSAGGTVEPDGGSDPETGIRITKQLTGSAAAWARGPFRFEVTCSLGGFTMPTVSLTLTPADRVGFVNPVPAGASCRVVEVDNGSAPGSTPVEVGTVVVPAPAAPPVEITAVNDFPGAQITVVKRTSGPAGSARYRFSLACTSTPDNGAAFPVDLSGAAAEGVTTATFTLAAGQQRTYTVPDGAVCRVVETDAGGATSTRYQITGGQRPEAVTVRGTVTVTVTNTFGGWMPTTGSSVGLLLIQWAIGLIGAGAMLRKSVDRRRAILP